MASHQFQEPESDMQPSDDAPTAVDLEVIRGRIKGVEREQKSHEDICLLRYTEIGRKHDDLKAAVTEQGKTLSTEIRGIKGTLAKAMGLALTIWLGLTAWSLKSQWDMQQDTNKALIQMTANMQGQNQTPLPYLPAAGVQRPLATPTPNQ